MMATLEKERDHTTGVFVKDLWGHAPHGALYFVGGWGRGNLVRFGRGQHENDYRILYFLVGDDKHPYAIMQLDGSKELKMLDASLLDKHRIDHPHRKAVHTMTKPDKEKDKADQALFLLPKLKDEKIPKDYVKYLDEEEGSKEDLSYVEWKKKQHWAGPIEQRKPIIKGDAFDHQANNSPKKALPKKSLSDEFKQIVAKDDPSSDQSSEDSFVQNSKVGRNIDKRYACNIRRRMPASGGDEGEKEAEVEGSPEYDFLTNSFFTRGASRMAIVHTPQVFEDTHENDELLQLKKHIFCWVQRKKSEPNSKFPKWPWLRDKATILRRLWKEWKAVKGLPARGGPKRGGAEGGHADTPSISGDVRTRRNPAVPYKL